MEPSAPGAEQGEAPRCCLLHRLASWWFAALIIFFPLFLSFPLHVFLPELDLRKFPKQRRAIPGLDGEAQPQGVHSHTTTDLPPRAPAWLGLHGCWCCEMGVPEMYGLAVSKELEAEFWFPWAHINAAVSHQSIKTFLFLFSAEHRGPVCYVLCWRKLPKCRP